MSRRLLTELLDRNDDHAASSAAAALAEQRDGQRPPVVSVCCADSRVSQEGMWTVDEPGFLFTAGNIGNRVSDVVGGDRVLSGSVAYPIGHTDTTVLVIVGHTGCGAVGAALDAARTGEFPDEPGVRADVEDLLPIVERGLDDPDVSADADASVRNQLVEYNVHEQVAFARGCDDVGDAEVYGFVYDFHRAYGERDGVAYLVNADGERDPAVVRDLVGEGHADHVATLL